MQAKAAEVEMKACKSTSSSSFAEISDADLGSCCTAGGRIPPSGPGTEFQPDAGSGSFISVHCGVCSFLHASHTRVSAILTTLILLVSPVFTAI